MPIHRNRDTTETIVVLRGRMIEIFYDDKGVETEWVSLPTDGIHGLQIDKGRWHSLITEEPTVIIEMKNGAYAPLIEDDILKENELS